MRILITGGSGFIGKQLIEHWATQHELVIIGRSTVKLQQQFPTLHCCCWENLNSIAPDEIDVVVNLAGETINHLRWTPAIKQQILQSRIMATQRLVDWAISRPNPNLHFCNASALSIYGLYDTMPRSPNTETTVITSHPELLCQVATQWETCLQPLATQGIRTSQLRFAVVLNSGAGAFPRLLKPAKLGLATRFGSGKQPFAWIGSKDLIRSIDWVVTKQLTGAINCVAPQILTQNEFNTILCHHLHRPYVLKMPAGLVRLIFGQMGDELLLRGPTGSPKVLENSGFIFNTPDFSSFLEQNVA